MSLKFKADNCIGCRLCQLACSGEKEGVFNPELARLKIISAYTKTGLIIRNSICNLCLACVSVCPTEAITYQDGHLMYDQSMCTDCESCVQECPEHVIGIRPDGVAVCDLCQGSPACVEWCPHHALTNEEAI
ncbi:4Fe-4S binding protein [Paradesulfitobacterium aromaticivorans]